MDQQLNPNDFHVPATDLKGHSARFQFRAAPTLARVLDTLIQSKQFPYRRIGDILRHATYRHVEWLKGVGSVSSVGGCVDAALDILRDDEMNADFLLLFEKLSERVGYYLKTGEDADAQKIVLRVKMQILSMPEDRWRDKYLAELERKFSRLLTGAEMMDFSDLTN